VRFVSLADIRNFRAINFEVRIAFHFGDAPRHRNDVRALSSEFLHFLNPSANSKMPWMIAFALFAARSRCLEEQAD
jgi:hypothetical protein